MEAELEHPRESCSPQRGEILQPRVVQRRPGLAGPIRRQPQRGETKHMTPRRKSKSVRHPAVVTPFRAVANHASDDLGLRKSLRLGLRIRPIQGQEIADDSRNFASIANKIVYFRFANG